jgi:hypothetical protein
VEWWGKVHSSMLPSLLFCSDLLLVCYQAKYHSDQANPHKLMEYFASGRTVVATYTAEYDSLAHLLAMGKAGTNSDYLELFDSVLANIEYWNAPARMLSRRQFAADHSYERQLERIRGFLQRYGYNLSAN